MCPPHDSPGRQVNRTDRLCCQTETGTDPETTSYFCRLQIAITDLGHERPTLLITNQTDVPARELVDRYARRMVIENTSATIEIKPGEIVVSLGRRANNPLLIAAGFAEQHQPIPWLGDRRLRIRFF